MPSQASSRLRTRIRRAGNRLGQAMNQGKRGLEGRGREEEKRGLRVRVHGEEGGVANPTFSKARRRKRPREPAGLGRGQVLAGKERTRGRLLGDQEGRPSNFGGRSVLDRASGHRAVPGTSRGGRDAVRKSGSSGSSWRIRILNPRTCAKLEGESGFSSKQGRYANE